MTKGEKWTILMAALSAAVGAAFLALRFMGMRFSGFVLLGVAVLLALGLGLRRWKQRSRLGRWCWNIFRIGTLAVILLLAALESNILLHGKGMPAAPADAVIVLGAGVNGTQPSLTLRTRLDAALEYLEGHPDIPVVVTGGQGYGENITEARCMYDYLTARGVDPARIILEEQATSTAENFAFSASCLVEAGIDPAADMIAVVTNDFHIYRANLIAARQGYGYVFGVPAELPWLHLEVNYYVREAFAMVKTLLLDY